MVVNKIKNYKKLVEEEEIQINDTELDILRAKALDLGASKVFIISPKDDLIFDDVVKLLCYNCKHYGVNLSCPPKVPDLDYEKIIKKYEKGLIVIVEMGFKDKKGFDKVRVETTNKLHKILLELEKDSFNRGNHFTTSFKGGSCRLCPECCGEYCKQPAFSRISLEGVGVDVIRTIKKFGSNLSFPVKKEMKLSRVGLLLSGKHKNI